MGLSIPIQLHTVQLLAFLVRGSDLVMPWSCTWSQLGSRQQCNNWKDRCLNDGNAFAYAHSVAKIIDELNCRPEDLGLDSDACALFRDVYPGFRDPPPSPASLAETIHCLSRCVNRWMGVKKQVLDPQAEEVTIAQLESWQANYQGPLRHRVTIFLGKQLQKSKGKPVQLKAFDRAWIAYHATPPNTNGHAAAGELTRKLNGTADSTTRLTHKSSRRQQIAVARQADDHELMRDLSRRVAMHLHDNRGDLDSSPGDVDVSRDFSVSSDSRQIAGRWRATSEDMAIDASGTNSEPRDPWWADLEVRELGAMFWGHGTDRDGDPVTVRGHLHESGNMMCVEYRIANPRIHAYGAGMLQHEPDGRTARGYVVARSTTRGADLRVAQMTMTLQDGSMGNEPQPADRLASPKRSQLKRPSAHSDATKLEQMRNDGEG